MNDESETHDWWKTVVIGFPTVVRHHSGRGFKPIVAVNYDYNVPFDLDSRKPELWRGWHDSSGSGNWDEVVVGESIFIFCTDDSPPFGFLATVTGVKADRSTLYIELHDWPRFQAWADVDVVAIAQPPQGWVKSVGYQQCPHMGPATFGSTGSVWVACPECSAKRVGVTP